MKLVFAGTTYKLHTLSLALYAFFLFFLLGLGFWQLTRATEKSHFLEQQQQATSKDTMTLTTIMSDNAASHRYRRIKLNGVYDASHQFLLDNQILKGQVGYFVVTPFRVQGSHRAVLVNRGWLPLNKDRRILPDVSITVLKNHLAGRINQFPGTGIILTGANTPTAGWPSVVQLVDYQVLAKKLGYPLFPFQIELDADMDEGYLREWKAVKIMLPQQHIAYAFQWFALAITLTYLFIRVSRVSDE